MNQSKSSGVIWGSILILLGILFLLVQFDFVDFGDIISTFWPVILIIIGIRLIRNRNRTQEVQNVQESNWTVVENDSGEEMVRSNKLFGDQSLKINAKDFSGGSVSNIIGDLNVDLSEIDLNAGEKVITLNGVIGDISVSVPKNVAFAVRANVILGDLKILDIRSDGFFVNRTYQSEGYETAAKKLFISVSQIIGDITVN